MAIIDMAIAATVFLVLTPYVLAMLAGAGIAILEAFFAVTAWIWPSVPCDPDVAALHAAELAELERLYAEAEQTQAQQTTVGGV